jgi:FHA domain
MSMASVSLTFAVYSGGQLVARETIAQSIIKVGKEPRSHLRINDETAVSKHAIIEVVSDSDITLIDLGSEQGTLVNGQRVNKCKVRAGDQIQVGQTIVQLEAVQAAGASVAPEAAPIENAFAASPSQAPAANPFAAPPSQAPAANPFAAPSQAPAANPFGTAPSQAPNPFGAAPANPFAAAPAVANPFAAASPFGGIEPVANAPGGTDLPGEHGYRLLKSGPDVNPDEVEVSHLASVEVRVLWGHNTLKVSHLTPPRSYYIGEEAVGAKNSTLDYAVPNEVIGSTRAPVVVARGGGAASLVILPRSTGVVSIPGQPKMTLADLTGSGRARPSSELSGAYEFDMPPGAMARMELENGLAFEVSAVNAGRMVPSDGIVPLLTSAAVAFFGLSFFAHAGVIASLAFFMPKMSADSAEEMDRDQLLLMQKMLNAAADREQEEKETPKADNAADSKEGGTGTRAKGEEGSMGNPNTTATGKRYGVQGPADNKDPHLAREAAKKEAADFGMIGLLNAGAAGDVNAPTAPWGREDSLGNDPMSAKGNMWGDSIGDSFGAGGLGLSGVGEGGGGRGEGIGLGNSGVLGHGAGTGTGQGFGSGSGRLAGAHQTKAPQIRQGATQVNGRLPAEVIQRIVRQNFGRFRMCYENGLRNNPHLTGRVAVRFIIDRSGAVSSVSDGGSDLPDQGVVGCVVRGFSGLSFPQPEGGIVTVVYPISFSPGE